MKKAKKVNILNNDTKISKSTKAFIALFIICALLSIISLIYNNGSNLNNIFFGDKDDYFMDFFNSLFYSYSARPYNYYVMYPPLINVLYYALSFFTPFYSSGEAFRTAYEGQLIYMAYNIALISSLIYAINRFIKSPKCSKNIQSIIVLSSIPVLYCFQRGNSALIALLFLIIYLTYKDSDNKFMKNLALMSLAISFNIKIYPAIFGLLLIKEKRYKDAIKCSIYAILLFVIPFLFFGGYDAFNNFMTGLKKESIHVSKLMFGWKVNFSNTISYILYLFKIKASSSFLSYSSYFILGVSIFSFFNIKEKWKEYLILGILISGFPAVSYPYTLIFLFPAILEFINKNEETKYNIIYAILLCFSIASFVFIDVGYLYSYSSWSYMKYYPTTLIEGLSILIMIIMLNINGIKNYILKKRKV